jgi:hypothetical protein
MNASGNSTAGQRELHALRARVVADQCSRMLMRYTYPEVVENTVNHTADSLSQALKAGK